MSKADVNAFYYHNDGGSGGIVYPKILSNNGKVLWDGRKVSGFQWELTVGESCTVYIETDAKVPPGTLVCAGFNVVAGRDVSDLSDIFTVGSVDWKASFEYVGPVSSGSIRFTGQGTDKDLEKFFEDEKHKVKGRHGKN